MLCSELIEKLEYAKSLYGDLPVKMENYFGRDYVAICEEAVAYEINNTHNYLLLMQDENDPNYLHIDTIEDEIIYNWKETINQDIVHQFANILLNFEEDCQIQNLQLIGDELSNLTNRLNDVIKAMNEAYRELEASCITI